MAITDAKLAKLGLKVEKKAMKDDCEILEKSKTPNESGGYSYVWVVVATVKCMVIAPTARPLQNIVGQQVVSEEDVYIHLPYGTTVKESQRLRIKGIVYRMVKHLIGSFDVTCKVSAVYSTLD
jgi:hypothetical protein